MPTFQGPYIRDELVVDAAVQEFYDRFEGDGPVYLLGRVVRHEQPLRVGARPVVVVADLYDGTGGAIDASGPGGAGGGGGADGRGVGVSGDPGGAGLPGGPGGTVTVYCRRSTGAQVSAWGGGGGGGGTGGNGSDGTADYQSAGQDIWVDDTPDDLSDSVGHYEHVDGEYVPGTAGGRGGFGGPGGAGGAGGTVTFTSVGDDTPPALDVRGGAGGPGGWGGTSGMYAAAEEDGGTTAPSGADGAWASDGTVTASTVSEEDFVAGLRPVLGIYANHWAPYRLAVGDWYHHLHNAAVAERAGYLTLAAVEVTRTLELQPDNVDALRLEQTLLDGRNALGLAPDLDLLPDFDDYMSAFTGFGALALNFVTSGTAAMVDALTLDQLAGTAELLRLQVVAARDDAVTQLAIARTAEQLEHDEADDVQARLDQATADIAAEQAAMEQAEIDADGFPLGTLAEIAGAVVAVIAAVPSGGASLVALVPAVAGLAGAVLAGAGPLAEAVLNGTDADVAEIETAYKAVDKQMPAVVKGAKSIIDFVKVVEKLTAITTPDNAKYVALVRRGVDLAHEALLAGRRAALAGRRADAVADQITRADGVIAQAAALRDAATKNAATVQATGQMMVAAAASCADALLGLAFRAQRSVEIYTLQDEGSRVLLDTGRLHPDVTRAHAEGRLDDAGLAQAIVRSWAGLLAPAAMQADYSAYFDNAPQPDQLRLTFAADSPEVAALRATGRFAFQVDLENLPDHRYDAKVNGVRIALVGATHPDDEISCQLRHGARYAQRRPDGSVAVQLLAPQTAVRKAMLTALPPDPGFDEDPPLQAPKALHLWGRGLAGDYELSVPPEETASGLDLSGLDRVQVWLAYQFLG